MALSAVEPDPGERAYRAAIRAFSDVAAALGEVRDQDALLHLVAEKICELVDVPRCSVYLRDDETGLYHGQVGHADHDIDALVKRLVCGTDADGFTSEIVETQAPVVVENAMNDPRPVRSAMRDWHVRSMLGVPMVLRGEVIGIFFLDSEDEQRRFTALDQSLASTFAELAAVAISQAQLYNELRSSHETVAKQNQMLRRAAAVDDRLTSLVLEGRNLREIAQAVTDLTGKPCSIHDASQRRLAWASPGDSETPLIPKLLDPEYVDQPEIAEALAALTSKKAAVIGPFPGAGLPRRFLVAPVTVRDDQWATLVLTEHGSRFTGLDLLIMRRTATVVALELSAERRAATAEWNVRASLASELIRGNRDIAQLESRAQFLGISLADPHALALVTTRRGQEVRIPNARAFGDALRAAHPELTVLATGVTEGVAVIVSLAGDGPPASRTQTVKDMVAAACADLDPEGRLVAAVSTACLAPADYVRAYNEARQVAACLDSFCTPDTTVLSADDLGAGRVFLSSAEPEEAARFAYDTLGALLDPALEGDLLGTLDCFFRSGRSVRQSASELGVHENTIRYRLSRIEEVVGLAVASDSDAQLSAQLALLVLRLRGLIPVAGRD